MATKTFDITCPIHYVRVTEETRDKGGEHCGDDVQAKIDEVQGNYTVTLELTDDEVAFMKTKVPHKGMSAGLFKGKGDGITHYQVKRGHFNPKFKDKDSGEVGVVVGAPAVIKADPDNEGMNLPWDMETDGIIGDGTVAKVRIEVWTSGSKGKVTLTAIKVLDLVEYEAKSDTSGM